MEVRRKEKTLSGLFLKYVAFFCVNTVLLTTGVFGLMLCALPAGFLLPANYAEVQLSENADQILLAGNSLEQWLPKGCTYSIYNDEGVWLAGNFPEKEQKVAWEYYKKNNNYAGYKEYYRFMPLDNGNVCIVKYRLVMRYANDWLNEFLPAPEALMPILDLILFILNAVLLSKGFAKKVKQQLQELSAITEKIAKNDLEFEPKASDIREINEIMVSLGWMKDTLQDSLKAQWDMEKIKQEQLSALAHDIKTPLTIIRGNAELLKERLLSAENQECTEYILANTNEIERYLEAMTQVVRGIGQGVEQAVFGWEELEEMFQKKAKQLAIAEKLPVSFDNRLLEGAACCEEMIFCEDLVYCNKEDILRAWSNIVGNAVEHTDQQRGIEILFRLKDREKKLYLAAIVRDYGPGFSSKDLKYADQEFYSGDASRHNRRHSGLGLSIAKRFVEEQGGFLEYGNRKNSMGAEVALWLKIGSSSVFKKAMTD